MQGETRCAADGEFYTKDQFIEFYSGLTEWDLCAPDFAHEDLGGDIEEDGWDEKPALVHDNGTGMMKYGFSG